MSTDPRTERTHRMSHGFLRSQAKCPQCDYVAPMDGPDRIVAALDRLTAALLAAASPSSSPVDAPSRPTGTPGPAAASCGKCGALLTRCAHCTRPAQCGEATCVEHTEATP